MSAVLALNLTTITLTFTKCIEKVIKGIKPTPQFKDVKIIVN